MKFKKEFLQDLAWDESIDDVDIIETKLVDTSRWSNIYEQIFKFGGNFYRTSYSLAATESQDESPYQYEGEEIECEQVEPTIVEVTKWV